MAKPPEVTAPTTLSADEVAAVAGAYHSSPKSVLGMHTTEVGGKQALVVRAFRPFDEGVAVLDIDKDRRYPMQKVHPEGFFEAVIPRRTKPFAYRLVLEGRDGKTHQIEDAYRFPLSLTDYDVHLHAEGTFYRGYEKLGGRMLERLGVRGANFAVWAPNALRVSVIGPFNGWDERVHPMQPVGGGLWELFIPDLPQGTSYKYDILSREGGYAVEKSDPYGFFSETRPSTASRLFDINAYTWGDDDWVAERPERQALDRPISIYEVHLGSWKRVPGEEGTLTYVDLAHQLVEHVLSMGFTHIELMPITEHPFDGSWGYQTTGFFAPTSRFGTPAEFKYFVDHCHQNGIGVILDWVPAHFPRDAHGLAFFDGTHLYEHEDPRQGEHKDWGTKVFNYGRNEVRNFLISSALFWLDEYHIDGLRVDAVASMLYLDYSKEEGEWIPNEYGGRENIEAIEFVRRLNEQVHAVVPGALTIAEESTAWPMVTLPAYTGGLGFDLKWNMGWMNDSLRYFEMDPIHRRYHQDLITFGLTYAFSENYVLPFSHDEVVHLKGSMLGKMPGDEWQQFAGLRLLYAFQYTHPGKKLLFMGAEIGQWREWSEARSLDWHLTAHRPHEQLLQFLARLNHVYRTEPALHEIDFEWDGFQWIDHSHAEYSIISFARWPKRPEDVVVAVLNMTPEPRPGYRVGLPVGGSWRMLLNSDDLAFGGSGFGYYGPFEADGEPWQNCPHSAVVDLPPLGAVLLKRA